MVLVLAVSLRPMPNELPDFGQMDKLYHFGAYFVMGLLWARAFNNGRAGRPLARTLLIAAVITFFFGAFVEVCQLFYPYRSADAVDAAVNGGGGVAGVVVYAWLRA